jgi:hypothetical protein
LQFALKICADAVRVLVSILVLIATLDASAQELKTFASLGSVDTEPMLGGKFYDLTNSPIAYVRGPDYSCTGTLIGDRIVLTAGHCIRVKAARYKVYIAAAAHSVVEAWYQSNYDHEGATDFSNSRYDLGILILANPVAGIKPVPVLYDDPVKVGEYAGILGFGINEISGLLTDVSLFYQGKIGAVAIELVRNGMLSSTNRYSDASTCGGDSGGPLVQLFGEGRFWAVAGIVSTGTNKYDENGSCIEGYLGISNYVDLQSKSSRGFLSEFPGVRYLSGKLVAFLLGAEELVARIDQAAGGRTLRILKRSSKQTARFSRGLKRLTDLKRKRILRRVVSALKRAARAGNKKLVKRLLQKARSGAWELVQFGTY